MIGDPGMKRVAMLAAAFALAAPASAGAADYAWPVVRVIDGDTVAVDASADLPPELADLRVRLRGIDAPEVGHRAGCDAERAAGAEAKEFAEELLAAAETVVVRDPEWGKWGGRVVADVILDGKHSLADWVALGARDWCGGAEPSSEPAAVATAPAAAGDVQAEVERHVLDPCLAASIRNGAAPVPLQVAGMEEATAVDMLKTIGAPEIARLAPMVRPLVAGRPWPIRAKFYAFLLDVCIADFAAVAPALGRRH